MTRSRIWLPLALAALTSPLAAQSVDLSTPGAWTQTWFGCDPDRSCYWVNIQASPDVDHFWLGSLHYRAWLFFEQAQGAFFHRFGDEIGGFGPSSFYSEGTDAYYPQFGRSPPEHLGVYIQYEGPHLPDGMELAVISLNKIAEHRTVTPEPASLLLIATGLGVIGAAKRRRKVAHG